MLQVIVIRDAFQFIPDNLFHILLDTVVILLHALFHAVYAVLVGKIRNDGYRFILLLFPFYFFGIHDNLTMKNLLDRKSVV